MKYWNNSLELLEEHTSCDAGQYTLLICTDRGTLIEIDSSGDWQQVLNDKSAKRIKEIWEDIQIVPIQPSDK